MLAQASVDTHFVKLYESQGTHTSFGSENPKRLAETSLIVTKVEKDGCSQVVKIAFSTTRDTNVERYFLLCVSLFSQVV